ncbi:MAG TPA: DNA-protecting protein DprA, partial [Chryseolinea sp.]|nr:DNA-protecting protein DprA [Chryseolinea sp.]
NSLIKSNRAHLITSVNDLEYVMNWSVEVKTPVRQELFKLDSYEPDERAILKVLIENNNQLVIDELSWRSGLSIGKLASLLLNLEFKGVLSTLPGKIYKLVKT